MANYTQKNRSLAIETELGKDRLLLHKLEVKDSISAPFNYTVELLSNENNISAQDIEKILGSKVKLSVAEPLNKTETYYYHGYITRFTKNLQKNGQFFSYSAEISPWFGLISRGDSCQVFQDMSVIEIINKVLTDLGCPAFNTKGVNEKYEKYSICIQYNESYFDFLSRIMAENGISYCFEHDQDECTLMITDNFNTTKKSSVELRLYDQILSSYTNKVPRLTQWNVNYHAMTNHYESNSFSAEQPKNAVNAESTSSFFNSDKSGVYSSYRYDGNYRSKTEGEKQVRKRKKTAECQYHTISASSNSLDLAAGYYFKLDKDSAEGAGECYLVTTIHFTVTEASYLSSASVSEEFSNTFECLPEKYPFSPSTTLTKPKLTMQTAVVIGSGSSSNDDSQVYTNEHGEIKVRFHWDMNKDTSSSSTCWIPVLQGFAQTIPRVGTVVAVEFINGDLNSPIVVGELLTQDGKPKFNPNHDNGKLSGLQAWPGSSGTAKEYSGLFFDDRTDKQKAELSGRKDVVITANDEESTITIKTKDGGTSIVLNQKSGAVSIVAKDITMDAESSLKLSAGSISISSGGALTLQGSTINEN